MMYNRISKNEKNLFFGKKIAQVWAVTLNAHNLPIFQPILMILASKFMVHRALSDKTYKSLGLLSPLRVNKREFSVYTVRIFMKCTHVCSTQKAY